MSDVMTGAYRPMREDIECTSEKGLRMPTTREKLTDRKMALEKHLSDINAALDALDQFPEFEKIHNLLTKAQV